MGEREEKGSMKQMEEWEGGGGERDGTKRWRYKYILYMKDCLIFLSLWGQFGLLES